MLLLFWWANKYICSRKYKIEFVQTLPLIIKNPDRHCAKSYMHKTFLWQNFHFRTISPLEHSWTTVPSPARAGDFLACVCAAFHLIETCCNSGCIEEVPVDLREVKLGSVPATDAVVRPKVPLDLEAVGLALVPLGQHKHVLAVLQWKKLWYWGGHGESSPGGWTMWWTSLCLGSGCAWA